MTKQTFSEDWQPEIGHRLDQEPKVKVISFGDGYETRIQEGINANREKWSLTFKKSTSVANSIIAFLKTSAALNAFYWKTPESSTKSFICRSWSVTRGEGYKTITCTFEQVFEA